MKFVRTAASLSFLYLAGLSMISQAWALSDQEIKDAIQETISQRHPHETGEWWRSLGPSAPKVILAMYRETDRIYWKIRLVDALAWFDDQDAVDFLKSEAESNPNPTIRTSAIHSVIRSQKMKEKDYISKKLSSDDSRVRAVVAQSLAELTEVDHSDTESARVLTEFLAKEKNPTIVARIKEHQSRLQAASSEQWVKKPRVNPDH